SVTVPMLSITPVSKPRQSTTLIRACIVTYGSHLRNEGIITMLPFTPEAVELAYRHAIFPMAMEDGRTIGWFRPDPRAIIPLDRFHISRSLAKTIRQGRFEATIDRDFEGVMRGCADREEGTWISEEFVRLY